jgi:hypothetical protein
MANPTVPKEIEGLTGVTMLAAGAVHCVAMVTSTLDLNA